jgi:hypothetical protein
MMIKTRFYNEPKAKRTLEHQNALIRKLNKSLNNRMKKEKFLEDEIKAIDGAYVNFNCKSCGAGLQTKFKEWQNGKFTRICQKCKYKQFKQDLTEICDKVQPLLPKGYVIHQRGIDEQIIIRKKD